MFFIVQIKHLALSGPCTWVMHVTNSTLSTMRITQPKNTFHIVTHPHSWDTLSGCGDSQKVHIVPVFFIVRYVRVGNHLCHLRSVHECPRMDGDTATRAHAVDVSDEQIRALQLAEERAERCAQGFFFLFFLVVAGQFPAQCCGEGLR